MLSVNGRLFVREYVDEQIELLSQKDNWYPERFIRVFKFGDSFSFFYAAALNVITGYIRGALETRANRELDHDELAEIDEIIMEKAPLISDLIKQKLTNVQSN